MIKHPLFLLVAILWICYRDSRALLVHTPVVVQIRGHNYRGVQGHQAESFTHKSDVPMLHRITGI